MGILPIALWKNYKKELKVAKFFCALSDAKGMNIKNMKLNFKQRVINVLRNIKYLTRVALADRDGEQMFQTLLRAEDLYIYEMQDLGKQNIMQVLDYEETVSLLVNKPKSFCRFGDGEIVLMNGQSISFQEYDSELAEGLKKILSDNDKTMYVGINYNYFHSTRQLNEFNRKFYLTEVKPYRDFLNKICNKDRTYIAAGFNQLYMALDNYDYKKHYDNLIKLLEDKEIVLFAGNGIIDKLKYNIFDYAKSCIYETGPIKNAFSDFDNLMERSRKYPKTKVICFILGPASKLLVATLNQEGYMAWDIGHLAKDYDAYCQNIEKTDNNIIEFYRPD